MGLRRTCRGLLALTCIGCAALTTARAALAQGYVGTPTPPGAGTQGITGFPGLGPRNPATGGTQGPAPAGQAPTAQGPAWIVVPRIGIDEIVTDNVRETSSGQQTDLISVISPGINVTGDTARIKASLDYSPQIQRYVKATDENRLAHNLFGDGKAIVVPDLLFFDTAASISQEDIAGGRGQTNSALIPEAQRTQVITYNASPALRTNIGTFATTELLYQFSQTYFSNNTGTVAATNPTGTTTPISDTTQHEGRFTLGTGEDFDRLHSSLVLDTLYEMGSGSTTAVNTTSERRKTGELDNEYQLTRAFSVLGQGGYENLTFPGVNIRGPIWAGGMRYRSPNPDTSVLLLYGRRDGGNDFTGDLRYGITASTKLFVTYTQGVETTQQAILQNLSNAQLGPSGTIINQTNGLPLSVVNPNFRLQNDIFRQRSLQGGLSSKLDRNTFTVTGFRIERISFTGVTPSDTTKGGSFQWSRELTPKTTGTLLLGYAIDTLGSGPTINVSLGVNHAFTDTLNGAVRYDFIRGGSGGGINGVGIGSASGTKFTQNALTLSLRKTF